MHTDLDTDHSTPVSEAIASLGGDSAVARLAGLSPWAISKWRKTMPPGRVLWLAEQTKWEKTPHELCPAIYPNPTDGLPPEVALGLLLKSTQDS